MWGRSMKHLVTHSCRPERPEGRPVDRRVLAVPGVLAVLRIGCAVLLLSASGCVTSGTYNEVVEQRDQLAGDKRGLERRVDELERSNASLDAERVQLFEELEDLRGEREELATDVAELRQAREQLSQSLAERELQLVAQDEEVDRLRGTYEGLVSDLEAEVSAGRIEIEQLRDGLRVNVSDEILFPSGSAVLNEEGREVLMKVADQLASSGHRIEVRGHTDNIPIRGGLAQRYPTNWELAGARSASVVRLFQERGIVGGRLTSVSRGEFDPVAPNGTPEERWLNRRIEIMLLPSEQDEAVPAKQASPVDEGDPARDSVDRQDL